MDLVLAIFAIALMSTLAVFAGVLLARMMKAILELHKVTTGLHDVMRWTLGRVAAEHPGALADGPLPSHAIGPSAAIRR
jgi:hypothetical protein